MARIQIQLPERFPFHTELPLYMSHINYGGHLDNALLLTVVSEARLRFFHHLGYQELDVEGAGIIVADAALQYISEAFHGEVMRIECAPQDLNKYGFDLVWQMRDKVTEREIARGKAGLVFVGHDSKRVCAIPPVFRAKLESLQAPATPI